MFHLNFCVSTIIFVAVVTLVANVQAADKPPCDMPPAFKQIGLACMNSGAKGKKEIMMCVFKKMGVLDDNNNFNIVKAFVLGSEVVMNKEGMKEKGIEGSLKCYDQFGQPGHGEEAVECVIAVFKEVCNM